MRIFWIGKGGTAGSAGGDEVYDRKLLARLGKMHEITQFVPEPLGRLAKAANLLRGVPLYRATYRSRALVDRLRQAIRAANPDIVVISWEPFDFLARAVDRPVVLLLHNLSSDAVVEVFGGGAVARVYAAGLRRYERRLYASRQVGAIVTLSEHDARIARQLAPGKFVTVVSPGAPPLAPPPAPRVEPELFLSGTYDWYPKRRDLAAAARVLSQDGAAGLSVTWDHSPPEAVKPLLDGAFADPSAWSPALRLGLVPDTFASGFKLKVTYYIANNCIVVSRAVVDDDYRGLPDQELFIRRIASPADAVAVYRELTAMDPQDLAARFQAFKEACADRFSWDKAAAELDAVFADAVAAAGPQAMREL